MGHQSAHYLTKFMGKSPKFDANPNKYVFLSGVKDWYTKVRKISQNLWKKLPDLTQNLTKFMGKPPKFDAIPNKYVFFTGGIEPGLTARPGGEN